MVPPSSSNHEVRSRDELSGTALTDVPVSSLLLLDSIGQAVIATDADGNIQYWNRGAQRLYGWSSDEVIGKSILGVTVPDVSQELAAAIISTLRNGEEWFGQLTLRRKDGSTFIGEVTDKPITNEEGRLIGIIGVSEDVTTREDALDALRHSEERFRQVAEAVPDLLFITDSEIRTLYINKRFTAFTGKPAEYAHGAGWVRILHPDDSEFVLDHWSSRMESGEPAEFRHRIRMVDGSYRWFLTRSKPLFGEDGKIEYWFGTSTDVDALVRAEEKIKALNTTLERRVAERTKQVRALSSALTLAEQRERKRISRFLHDDIQQLLYGIKLKSDALGRGLADEEARSKLDGLGDALGEAIQAVRSLTIELSPPVLQGEGLSTALEWLALHLEERYDLQVTIEACDDCEIPHEDQRILIFQIIRELLFNVIKHAQAKQAVVMVERVEGDVCITVRDEGVGFDVSKVSDEENLDSFGLVSIRERLSLFGGTLEIESAPGAGCTMTVLAPIHS